MYLTDNVKEYPEHSGLVFKHLFRKTTIIYDLSNFNLDSFLLHYYISLNTSVLRNLLLPGFHWFSKFRVSGLLCFVMFVYI